MFAYIKSLYLNLCDKGLRVPVVYDAVTKLPSVTLFFTYITFLMVVISLVLLHLDKQLWQATVTTICVWVLAVVFYRLRALDKVDVNLKNESIDLEDNQKDGK